MLPYRGGAKGCCSSSHSAELYRHYWNGDVCCTNKVWKGHDMPVITTTRQEVRRNGRFHLFDRIFHKVNNLKPRSFGRTAPLEREYCKQASTQGVLATVHQSSLVVNQHLRRSQTRAASPTLPYFPIRGMSLANGTATTVPFTPRISSRTTERKHHRADRGPGLSDKQLTRVSRVINSTDPRD